MLFEQTENQNCVLYVSGVNILTTREQLFNFFELFSKDLIDVQIHSVHPEKQELSARIIFNKPAQVEDIMDFINFREYDGHVWKAHIENQRSQKARHNQKANLFIKYSSQYDGISERNLYELFCMCGQILSIKLVREKRIAFCQFYEEDSKYRAMYMNIEGMIFADKTDGPASRFNSNKKDGPASRVNSNKTNGPASRVNSNKTDGPASRVNSNNRLQNSFEKQPIKERPSFNIQRKNSQSLAM